MWYFAIVIVLIVIIFLVKQKKSGVAAKGGQSLKDVKSTDDAQTVRATVIRKDICTPAQTDSRPAPYFTSNQQAPSSQKIYGALFFELENGKKKQFYVSITNFNAVSEGYNGLLTFTGNHFIKFEADGASE